MGMRTWAALAAFALSSAGCQILSWQWVTPSTVSAGTLFTIELHGVTDGAFGSVAAVMQLPDGFDVVATTAFRSETPQQVWVSQGPSALSSLYTADSGHHLVVFSGSLTTPQAAPSSVDLKVYLRAPAVAGTYRLELALAAMVAGWAPQGGLHSFQAPGGSVVRMLQVTAPPIQSPFALRDAAWPPTPATLDLRPVDIALADVDADGRDDLVEVMAMTTVRWRRSIPGGFASTPTVMYQTSLPALLSIDPADVDLDGHLDFALSNGVVVFGNGGTSWTPVTAASFGTHLMAAAGVGDVDGDGLPDVVFADGSRTVVMRSQPNRTFVPWSQGLPATPGGAPSVLHVVDLDADGRAEIISGPRFGFFDQRVYRSTAQGQWGVVGTLFADDVAVFDANGDGYRHELLLPDGFLVGYSTQGFTVSQSQALAFTRAAVLDHDGDGRDDLLIARDIGPLELWRGTATGALLPVPLPAAYGFSSVRPVAAIAVGDLDGDAMPDLAAVCDLALTWRNTRRGTVSYGEGCTAPGQAPALSVVGSLGAGQAAALRLSGSQPGHWSLLWVGDSRTTWSGHPLPIDLALAGAPGCTLLAEPAAVFGMATDPTGAATLPFTLPMLPPTLEVALFAQGAVVVPGANPLGAVFTAGLVLKVQ